MKTSASQSHVYSIVVTTTATKEAAEKIADALLAEQLAACIQVTAIKSYYTWKGSRSADDECLLLIKCKTAHYAEIERCIKGNHSYETPEIIRVPIAEGSSAYLGWIDEVSKK